MTVDTNALSNNCFKGGGPAARKYLMSKFLCIRSCSCAVWHGREYRVWDPSEESALRAGVKKHGLGAWERIRTDPEFNVLA